MNDFQVEHYTVSSHGPCYVIAEIGNNHQGELKTALKMIKVAASMGVNAVKFQKRCNSALFTKAMYNKPYDNPNSYGATYGEHRDYLEFNKKEYQELMACAQDNEVDFFVTPFDFESVDFLEDLGVKAYKIASGDLTNIPLIEYVAKLNKPMFVSTGASSLQEIHMAHQAVNAHHDKLCLLHCTSGYPTEYENLNLKVIESLRRAFPEVAIGYSGHDYGILAAAMAYMMGACVVEKHFTLNRSWKGTDHKFSLEPTGLHKMVRDLRRIDISLGDGEKIVQDFEQEARQKMGKGLYANRNLKAGSTLRREDISIKSPGAGIPPYMLSELLGKKLVVDVPAEIALGFSHFGLKQDSKVA